MRAISLTNATSVPNPAAGQPDEPDAFEAGPDGVFDLPHEYAVHLTTKHASQWRGESEHEATLHTARLEEMRNPHLVAPTLVDHTSRIEALEAKVEALLARLEPGVGGRLLAAEGDARDEPVQPLAAPEPAEPKPTRARKTAASGKGRQSKTEDPAADGDGARDEQPPA